jgi:hypothetical protein
MRRQTEGESKLSLECGNWRDVERTVAEPNYSRAHERQKAGDNYISSHKVSRGFVMDVNQDGGIKRSEKPRFFASLNEPYHRDNQASRDE